MPVRALDAVDPAPYEEAVESFLAHLSSFRGKGILTVALQDDAPRRVDFLLLVEHRDRVRLRGSRAIGPPIFEVVGNGPDFHLVIPSERRVYIGRGGDDAGGATPLRPETLVSPLRPTLAPEGIRFVRRVAGGEALVEIIRDEGSGYWRLHRQFEFDGAEGRLTRSVAFGERAEVLTAVDFSDYRTAGTGEQTFVFPFLVTIAQPQERTTVMLQFSEVAANPAIPPTAFALAVPAGYMRYPLDAFDLRRIGKQ